MKPFLMVCGAITAWTLMLLAPVARAETSLAVAVEVIEPGEIELALEVLALQGFQQQFASAMDTLAPLIGDSIKANAPGIDDEARDRLLEVLLDVLGERDWNKPGPALRPLALKDGLSCLTQVVEVVQLG